MERGRNLRMRDYIARIVLPVALPVMGILTGACADDPSREGNSRPIPSINGAKVEPKILSGEPIEQSLIDNRTGHPWSSDLIENQQQASSAGLDLTDRPMPPIGRARVRVNE